ncbi:LacI family DNA-binding transcriptional regulator [Flavobacterium segetis]|uniref:LacI family DNA-binding transcriptional regulator n=1 Tax=Flavobacterium segetis TaxID=271157 RepID=UPI00373FC8A4
MAAHLGVSTTTILKVLKGYGDVGPLTKVAVMNIAKKLTYSPNNFKVNLRAKESKTIRLIIPVLAHYFT